MTNITINFKNLNDRLLRCKVSANALIDFGKYMGGAEEYIILPIPPRIEVSQNPRNRVNYPLHFAEISTFPELFHLDVF